MPRIARAQLNAHLFHVLNRGNDRTVIFHKDGDYHAFLRCFGNAKAKHLVRALCFCLMPSHFHFLLHADTPRTLGMFMHRWMTSHVRRYHAHHRCHPLQRSLSRQSARDPGYETCYRPY